MSLIIKPPSWGHCTTNLTGTPSTSVLGTPITMNANDTMGTAVSFLANITHDVEYLIIAINGALASTGNGSALMHVLVDPAGGSTWASTPLISYLVCGESFTSTNTAPYPLVYYFPIWLKAGHSIGGQMQTAHTANVTSPEVTVWAYGGNANPGSWWCGTTVETIGVDNTTSQGQNHTTGSTGAYSSWTSLGSTLSKPCGALQFAVQGTNTDTASTALAYFFEFGAGSTRIGPNIMRLQGTTESGWTSHTGPLFYSLPAGTQLQVRGTCSGVPEPIDVAAYAVM